MKKKIDVMFLGGLFPKEIENEIIDNSKKNVQNAANTLQWAILEGLNFHLNGNLFVLNSMYIGSFPILYKKPFIKDFYFYEGISTKNNSFNSGFINLPVYKQLSRYNNLKKEVTKWINNSENKKIVIAYAMTITFTKLLKYIKKLDGNIITCLIVPDLPQFMNVNGKAVYKILKNFEIEEINKDLEYIDKFVILTEAMKDVLDIDKEFTVIEGIAPVIKKKKVGNFEKIINKTILYSGGIEKEYGVIDLIEGFINAKNSEEWTLVLCGSGSMVDEVKKRTESIPNINFLGLIPREEVLQIQESASLLVNPRNNDNEFVKYSFPSKTLEYMSSGTTLLGFKLDGIPSEYNQYMYLIDDYEFSIQKAFEYIFEINPKDLIALGLKAKSFVENEKNPIFQTKKIIDFLNGSIYEN